MTRHQALLALIFAALVVPFVRAEDPPATQKAQPIDYKKLKELLPEELLGQKRTKAEGQKTSIGEFVMSQATGNYGDESKEDAPRIELQVIDYSAAKGMAEGMAAWKNLEIDKEGDDGFERTTKIAEQPAFQTFQKEGKSGQVNIFIANRYLVTVQMNNVTAEDVKKVGEGIPVARLVELK